MDLYTWTRTRKGRAKKLGADIAMCKACGLATDDMEHWFLKCLKTEPVKKRIWYDLTADFGEGIERLSDKECMILAKGAVGQETVQKIRIGQLS